MDRLEIFKCMRQIADITFERLDALPKTGLHCRLVDYRYLEPNPYYNRTLDGLFLEVYYGWPHGLYSPWGQWYFAGGGVGTPEGWRDFVQELLPVFDCTLHSAATETAHGGKQGPVYAIHRVGKVVLPTPILRPTGNPLDPWNTSESCRLALEDWDLMKKKAR